MSVETIALILFVAVLIIGAAAFWWFNPSSPAVRVIPPFTPSNELERLLMAAVESQSTSSELRHALRTSVLWGLESPDAPGQPMTLSLTFPPEFASSVGEHLTTADGKIQFGPYVVCFSSRGVIELLSADRVFGPLVTQLGQVREFSAKQIYEAALRQQLDVVLNPFVGVSRRFSQAELQDLVD